MPSYPGRFLRSAAAFPLAVAALCLASFSGALAQNGSAPTALATVSPRTAGVGEQAVLMIAVRGARSVTEFPQFIEAEGLDIDYVGSQRISRGIGNQTFLEMRFTYTVVADEAGSYTIPPQPLVADGQTIESPAVTITVDESAASVSELDPFLRLRVEKKEIFVGEVVPVVLELFVHRDTNLLRQGLPELPREDFVVKRFDRPTLTTLEINDSLYSVYAFESSLSAIRPGEIDLGPARLECIVSVPIRQRAGLPSLFQQSTTKSFKLPSNAVTLTVKPLPEDDQPDAFAGAVGQFSLSVSATPQQLEVGDPIAVTMTVTGKGNFEALTVPELADQSGWKLYPPSQMTEHRSTILQPGAEVFSQVLIPEQVMSEIPSFELVYFNPETQRYETIRSSPISLAMTPDSTPGMPAATASFGSGGERVGASIPEEELGDILDVLQAAPAQWSRPAADLVSHPAFWAAQSVPLAVLAALAVIGLRRRKDDSAAQQAAESAAENAPRELSAIRRDIQQAAGDSAAFYRLVHEFLNAASAAHSDSLAALRSKADFYAFGFTGQKSGSSVPDAERDAVLRDLDALARNRT